MSKYSSTNKSNQYVWKENFEEFRDEEALNYHFGVTQYPFNLNLYDKLMEKFLEPIISSPAPLQILDAGGGTGKWSVYFAKRGHKVTLMDVALPMLEVAGRVMEEEGLTNNVIVEQGDIVHLHYSDSSFDAVFSDRNPISHCGKKDDSYQAFNELYRVLKPGGYVIGSVLNRMRKVAQMAMELDLDRALRLAEQGDIQRAENEYTHYYMLDELKACLANTGFTNIRIYPTTVFTELIPTAWLLDEIPLAKLLQLELKARELPELASYGVRFHFLARKPE